MSEKKDDGIWRCICGPQALKKPIGQSQAGRTTIEG